MKQIMSYLDEIIHDQKNNKAVGITSICSANPKVLETSLRYARKTGNLVLIESTCNQVNQFGGYTGMTPAVFVANLRNLAKQIGFSTEHIDWGRPFRSQCMEKRDRRLSDEKVPHPGA